MDAPSCTGCNVLIEEGSVIAFGDSLFHPSCFNCAKCSKPVDCESNLLLLTNGKPVCESCSYSCNVCKQTIRNEAIMTGDEAYHAECFKCVSCHKRIENLIFTQTSKGIHCTPCHEKRKTDKQRRRKEREKRQKLKELNTADVAPLSSASTPVPSLHIKLQSRPLPSIPIPPPNHLYNTDSTTPRSRSPLLTPPPHINPPTPSRSPNPSPDASPKLSMDDTKPTPSEPIPLKSPSSPPISVGSCSPAASLSQTTSFFGPMSPPVPNSMPTSPTLLSPTYPNTFSSSTGGMQDFNLSFFDNESSDLLNLTKTLGASISINIYGSEEDKSKAEAVPVIVETTAKLTRASQYLESSLADVFSDNDEEEPAVIKESDREAQLVSDLETAHAKLSALQTKYTKIKEASRDALAEFTNAKEEFTKEVSLRQQQEYKILELKHQLDMLCRSKSMNRSEMAAITKGEIERVARMRQELDKSCNDLKGYRNMLLLDIESLVQQKQSALEMNATSHLREQQKALLTEINSMKLERDYIQDTTRDLEKTRDDTLYEMVMLNTKNAELSEMNNDLSRRVTEREREAVAVMAGTSFLFSPSASLSSELVSPTSMPRKSSEASIVNTTDALNFTVQPKLFKLKKKGNMFAKLSGKNNKVDQSTTAIYGIANSSAMNVSSHSIGPDRRERLKSGDNTHNFQPTSFLRRTKCDACGDKMWGSSELRCSSCSYSIHTRCLATVPQLCYGSNTTTSFELNASELDLGKSPVALFGADLGQRAQYEERSIPWIIEACISAVELRGMDYEGIYRKSGGASQMRLIQRSFDCGEPIDLKDDDLVNDICAVTSILKQYFRELPNPLLPYHLYSQFINSVSIHDPHEKSDKFMEMLSQLSKVNYDTLKFLIHHLHRVQERHDENYMTTKNLAMIFGPTLMRDVESNRDLIDMSFKNAVIEYLIVHANDLLP